ncbi:hypothetical protein J7399_02980 [Shimia sp. R9_1]|uniref:hypothetical protein n=1 Tax=Shimia sp. R9_1 TaxID=2821111 RepID=UPI001ADB7DE8|nr:hypothetical protein [Shimia sp. R9_1]MBO9406380.1 hypothetical protein [Shimia sp. R9_1]
MRCAKLLFMFATASAVTVGTSAFAAPPEGKTSSIKIAGKLYGSVCQNAYPNLKLATATAEANGFEIDKSTGLYEHPKWAIQLRVNKEVCNGRFVVQKGRDKLPGGEFAEWATQMIKPGAKPGSPHIETTPLSATRFNLSVFRKR